MADKKEQAIATERGPRCDNPDCGFQIELDSSYVAELRRYPELEAEWESGPVCFRCKTGRWRIARPH